VKLYIHPLSSNARRAHFAARLCHVPVEPIVVDLMKGEHKNPEFLRRNPNGKVPVLVDGDFVVWESNAIAVYFATKVGRFDLYPHDAKMRARISQWQHWQQNHFSPPISKLVYQRILKPQSGGTPDPDVEVSAEAEFRQAASVLETALRDKLWMLGENLTLADVALAPTLMHADAARLPVQEFPLLAQWWARFRELDAWWESAV